MDTQQIILYVVANVIVIGLILGLTIPVYLSKSSVKTKDDSASKKNKKQ
jgi:hypothetical protein